MPAMTRITVLVDNTTVRPGTLAEHGLSFWIEHRRHDVLFDTGQGNALPHNSSALGMDLPAAHSIVLSHGHYDHTGGLRFALGRARQARLFLHPDALRRRYAGGDGQVREIGLASVTESDLRKDERRLVWTTGPTEVAPGIWATGEIPRQTDFEDTGGDFYLDPGLVRRDPIFDDQALCIDIGPGLVVVLGCAHAGVINTLQHIQGLARRPIHAVLGGMHLVNASDGRVSRTVQALRDMKIPMLAPAHCTGQRAASDLRVSFPGQVSDCSVGMQWTFAGKPAVESEV